MRPSNSYVELAELAVLDTREGRKKRDQTIELRLSGSTFTPIGRGQKKNSTTKPANTTNNLPQARAVSERTKSEVEVASLHRIGKYET